MMARVLLYGRAHADKEGSPDGAKLPSKGAKPKSAKKTKASETAEPASNDPDRVFVDYKSHVCSMALHLPLQAPKLLMLEVVERVAASVMVRVTKGIDKVRPGCLVWLLTHPCMYVRLAAHNHKGIDKVRLSTDLVCASLSSVGVMRSA